MEQKAHHKTYAQDWACFITSLILISWAPTKGHDQSEMCQLNSLALTF